MGGQIHTSTQNGGSLKLSPTCSHSYPLLHSFCLILSLPLPNCCRICWNTKGSCWSSYSIMQVHLWLEENLYSRWVLSSCHPVLFFVIVNHAVVPFKVYFNQTAVRYSYSCVNTANLRPITFPEGVLFTCGGTLLHLLNMLIEFLCSLIKRIEFASAVGCYMASWICSRSHKPTQKLGNTHSRACTLLSIPADSLLIARGLTGSGGVIAAEF